MTHEAVPADLFLAVLYMFNDRLIYRYNYCNIITLDHFDDLSGGPN